MSKYKEFVESTEDRVHFQEWLGDNYIFNGVIDNATGKGVGRIFRIEDEIELDVSKNDDWINTIVRRYMK